MGTKKFILNVAPTGIIPTKKTTPHVPITPGEIVREILDLASRGVTMVHLHARDPETDKPAYQKEIYAEIIHGIRSREKDLILCVSTSGRIFPEFEKRSDVLELRGEVKPDFASLTLSSLNFREEASMNSPRMVESLASKMMERNIRPEIEVFDLGMINYAKYLMKKGLITAPCYLNLILGNVASAQADLLSMGLMVRELPEGSIWSAGGIGDSQLTVNVMALVAGGGVRVGLEDNLWMDRDRSSLATNRELVERLISIANELGLSPYTPREARAVLGM
ncbi:MAG: 3-keto-5-aminohexanoate cleavage protein [Candidatus Abyssobacteria bacterium SURF_17]|uniref:3-keto-5-aminohexanoate cleavage protein n=1 Tax=Candidatus Abyssobacteria bacterium SURF_17 TaxID=2093361 RepID=A0A419EQ85_9BACT|nr:MAG: 3-keto-5-aminohexanoate cleavage protein [Candidatus Abyssubacteria bacterium SURF_17]